MFLVAFPDITNKISEKVSSFVAMRPKVAMYGISLGVTLGLAIGLSYVFAPHEVFAAFIRRGPMAKTIWNVLS